MKAAQLPNMESRFGLTTCHSRLQARDKSWPGIHLDVWVAASS